MNEDYLKVRIVSPRQLMFNDKATSVTSANSSGEFDILPQHANFITLVENNFISIQKSDGQIAKYKVPFAVLYHSNNQVNIYVDLQTKLVSN